MIGFKMNFSATLELIYTPYDSDIDMEAYAGLKLAS